MLVGVSVDRRQCHHRFNPDISAGENPVNPLGQLAQNDIFCTGQSIKIPFAINEFHEHCSLPLYWVYIQYLYCVFIRYSREGVMMPRRSDIEIAWYSSIQQEPNGRKTVTTQRFVQGLSKVNWEFSLKDANAWIESSVSTFKYLSMVEGEERTFMLYSLDLCDAHFHNLVRTTSFLIKCRCLILGVYIINDDLLQLFSRY
ncbi:hypothetical protein EcSMS35_1883 [Escherichia coli SMS-3-5]|nr:hypothetical protein EcSMS35_1883 [Escherichia coli SMS-3-5]